MEKKAIKRKYDKLAIVTTSTGAILLIISIIRGAMMLVAFASGIHIHTIKDVSFGVINFAFDFAIPFIGGIILIVAGMALLNAEFNSVRHMSTMEARRSARHREIRLTGKMLNEGDKMVLDMLSEKGSMLQSDIVSVSGFSKVKVHRIVRKLENVGLVKVSRFGITNRIVLADNGSSAFNAKA